MSSTKNLVLYEEIIEDDVFTVLKSIVVEESFRYIVNERKKLVRSEALALI